MGTYDTLYRIKKMELQDCQYKKISLEEVIASLAEKEKRLDAEMAEQDKLVKENNVYRMTYSLFFERYQKRKSDCRQEQAIANKELQVLVDIMHVKFGEMKKMEILQQQQREKKLSEEVFSENSSRDENTLVKVVRDNLGLN